LNIDQNRERIFILKETFAIPIQSSSCSNNRWARLFFPLICLLVTLALLAWLAGAALAGTAQPQAGFGVNGRVTTDFGFKSVECATSTLIQPDGKILVAGGMYCPGWYGDVSHILVRYNSNGSLDTSFGSSGKAYPDFSNKMDIANALALQSDGKIVVVGEDGSDFILARYNTNGSLDTSFGTGGLMITDFYGGVDYAFSVAIQSDGKIVVAGGHSNSTSYTDSFALARYNSNGSLDASFGNDGKQTVDFENSDTYGYAVSIQTDGKIVVAGELYDNSRYTRSIALARFETNGNLDTNFDTDGKVVTDFESWASGLAMALQPNGKIIVVGSTPDPSTSEISFALARYNTNGSLDTTFDTDGRAITSFSEGPAEGYAVTLQPDGKIVVAGQAGDYDFEYAFAVARYNTNGSLDTSFDADGKLTTSPGRWSSAQGVAFSANKVLAVGWAYENFWGDSDIALVRYDSSGSLDTSFDADGKVLTNLTQGDDWVNSLALQTDGKIIAAGASGSGWTPSLARYNSDGNLDTSFDVDGKVTDGSFDESLGVVIQPDGKIVTGGYGHDASGYDDDFYVARYCPNGLPDDGINCGGSGFGVNGGASGGDDAMDEYGYSTTLQPDGKIVLAGTSELKFGLARFTTTGTLDTSFGAGGITTTQIGVWSWGIAVAVQTDGKIVVAGSSNNGENNDFALARYCTNGKLDNGMNCGGPGFSADGVITTTFGVNEIAESLTLQPDGKVIAAGYSDDNFVVARYNTNGSLDTSFDGDGWKTIDFGANDRGMAVELQPDGKIILAGRTRPLAASMSNSMPGAARSFTQSNQPTLRNASSHFIKNGDQSAYFTDWLTTAPIASGNRPVHLKRNFRSAPGPEDSIQPQAINGSNVDIAMIRLDTNGNPDETFAPGGKVTIDFGGNDYAYDLLLLPDGSILVGGSTFDGWQSDYALARIYAMPNRVYIPLVRR
jgi:uncharacterized delta-60 repeat protein